MIHRVKAYVSLVDVNSWVWDFGDGQMGSGVCPLHYYVGIGHYNFLVEVTTITGCSDSISKKGSVIVKPDAIINPTLQCACIQVRMEEKSQHIISGVTKYYWDFGDGTYSNDFIPVKTKILNMPIRGNKMT